MNFGGISLRFFARKVIKPKTLKMEKEELAQAVSEVFAQEQNPERLSETFNIYSHYTRPLDPDQRIRVLLQAESKSNAHFFQAFSEEFANAESLLNLSDEQFLDLINLLRKTRKIDLSTKKEMLLSRIDNIRETSFEMICSIVKFAKKTGYELEENMVLNLLVKNKNGYTMSSLVRLLHFFGESGIRYNSVKSFLEKGILSQNQLDLNKSDIIKGFEAYSAFFQKTRNLNVLDFFSARLMKISETLSPKEATRLIILSGDLSYPNKILLSTCENSIRKSLLLLQKAKEPKKPLPSSQEEGEQTEATRSSPSQKVELTNPQTTGNSHELSPETIGKLLVSFCRLNYVSPEFIPELESMFFEQMNSAKPEAIVDFIVAHSFLSSETWNALEEKKSQVLKRSFKNMRKYNDTFFETVLPLVETKIDLFEPRDLLKIGIAGATQPSVKKNALKRSMMNITDFAITKCHQIEMEPEEKRRVLYLLSKTFNKFAYKPVHIE